MLLVIGTLESFPVSLSLFRASPDPRGSPAARDRRNLSLAAPGLLRTCLARYFLASRQCGARCCADICWPVKRIRVREAFLRLGIH